MGALSSCCSSSRGETFDVNPPQSTLARQRGERSDVHIPQSTSAQQREERSDVHIPQSTSAQQGEERSDVHIPQSTSAQQGEEISDVHIPQSTSAQQREERSDVHIPQSTSAQQREEKSDVHIPQSTSAQQREERSDVHIPQSTSAQQREERSDVHIPQSTSAQQGEERSDLHIPQSTSAQQGEEISDVHIPQSTSAQQGEERSDVHIPQSTSAQQGEERSDVHIPQSTSAQQGEERSDVHIPQSTSAQQGEERSDVHIPQSTSAQQGEERSDVHIPQSTSARQGGKRFDIHSPQSTSAEQIEESCDFHLSQSAEVQSESRIPFGEGVTAQQGRDESEASGVKQKVVGKMEEKKKTNKKKKTDESQKSGDPVRYSGDEINPTQSTSAQQEEGRSDFCSIQSKKVSSKTNEGGRQTSHKAETTVKPEPNDQMTGTQSAATVMSEEDKNLLNSRLPELVSKISIEDGMLLAHLRSRRALTQQQEEYIKGGGERSNQVRCLLDVLLKGDSNNVDKLIYSMRASAQSHVVDEWLRKPSLPDDGWHIHTETAGLGATNFPSEADTNLLERCRAKMMGDIKLVKGNLLAELRSRGVLTESEEGYIKEITGASNAVGYVVDLLLRKDPISLEEFLHALNHSGHSFVVDYLRAPTTPDETRFVRGGVSTAELQKALKSNMQDRLDEWKTALEEGVSSQEGLLPYINQPCKETKASQKRSLNNTIELVENSRPGDRIVLYGEAGMGKTTLLKQLTRSWIDKSNIELVDKFTFVFLIPLRLIGKTSLLNIICEELELVPLSNAGNLKEALDRNERKTLFLLDSFEELRGDVVKAKHTAIDDLIKGRLFPKSTVVITSRPGSRLKPAEDQTTAQLEDLPEHEVKEVIKRHFGKNEDAVDKVQRSFPAMAYLQKPINLALFIFIITRNKHLTLAYTQAELFSLVLQYIMLAFAKKKNLGEFTPQPCSYIANKDIPWEIRLIFKDIAKNCYEQRKKKTVKLHIKDADNQRQYLEFGLFTAGTDSKTVHLPHRLFVEYFSSAHLAENPDTWKALFEKIKKKSERESPRPPLPDVVRSMGLENILRFVIALSPQPQLDQVCQQVGSLFVLERKVRGYYDCSKYQLVNFEYYAELLRDCGEESGRRALAYALVNAPVRDVTDTDREEDRSLILLPYLDNEQCTTFLKKILVHNFDLCVKDGKSTLSHINAITVENIKMAVALVFQYDSIIKADELVIRGVLSRRLDLPVSMLTRMSGVRQLRLHYCTLCEEFPDYMSDINRSAAVQHSSPCPTNSSLERVELDEVEGLEHCDVITSRQCQLVMRGCGDVRARTLKTCFPRVSELELGGTIVVYEKEELTLWLSTIPTVRALNLAPQHEGESLSLCHLLNILAERELEYLGLYRYTLLLDIRDTTVKQNNTLRRLGLEDCKGDTDLGKLLEVCSRQCPQLKEVGVYSSNLVFDDEKVESVEQLPLVPGLQRFTLWKSAVHIPAGQRLSEQEAKQLLRRLCLLAQIYVWGYPKPKSASGSGTKD